VKLIGQRKVYCPKLARILEFHVGLQETFAIEQMKGIVPKQYSRELPKLQERIIDFIPGVWELQTQYLSVNALDLCNANLKRIIRDNWNVSKLARLKA
jgi:hypothetical protein